MTDPFLPSFVCPAGEEERYAVLGHSVGPLVEIALSREHREKHRFGSDTYTPVEVLAVKRFPDSEESAYMAYADHLSDAARYAARGELGYEVHTSPEGAGVRVSLVGRLLGQDGQLQTEISDEHYFEDPDSGAVLRRAEEKAIELRARAEQLNEEWVSLRRARVHELQTEYEKADAETEAKAQAQAQAAQDLQGIIDAEQN